MIILLIIGFLLKPMPNFEHSSPRELPWALPDINQAYTNYQYLDNGQILIEITHVPLINITPKMLAWFYQNLPISTVQIDQTTLPWYHIFHPTEHGVISVVEHATSNLPGMGVGALIQRKEWFGDFNSQGAGRIINFSEQGMTIKPELAGLHFGQIEHSFIQTNKGSQYTVKSLIGSDLPVLGPIINLVIRYKMFPEPMIKQWLRHQVEEVGSLNSFLPQLYGAKHNEHHYRLQLSTQAELN